MSRHHITRAARARVVGAQAVARLLFAPQIAAAVAASSCSLAAARHDASLARPAALVAFASAFAGGFVRPALWRRGRDGARRLDTARRGGDVAPGTSRRGRGCCGR